MGQSLDRVETAPYPVDNGGNYTHMLLALALVVVGVLFFFRNVGILPAPAWDIVWPLILIILGAGVLLGGKHTGAACWTGCSCADTKKSRR